MQSLKDTQKEAETFVRDYTAKEGEAMNIVKICWLIYCSEYGELRKLNGCSGLDDLGAVKMDSFEMKKIVQSFGI